MKKISMGSTMPFITGVIANGVIPVEPGKSDLSYLRPVHMEAEIGKKPQKYFGCRSSGCRTLKRCICSCKDCKRWCKYRGVTIIDTDGTVNIRDADGKLIVFMPREEYENVRVHWERLGLKLQPPAPGVAMEIAGAADPVIPG